MKTIAGTKIRVVLEDDSRWYCVRDITDFLDYGHEASSYCRFYTSCKVPVEIRKIKIETIGGAQPAMFVRDSSLVYLVAHCKKPKTTLLMLTLGIWSSDTARNLHKYFPDGMVQTRWVDHYRVELYFPDYGLIVDGSSDLSAERTEKINTALDNPEWIRYESGTVDLPSVITKITSAMHRKLKR